MHPVPNRPYPGQHADQGTDASARAEPNSSSVACHGALRAARLPSGPWGQSTHGDRFETLGRGEVRRAPRRPRRENTPRIWASTRDLVDAVVTGWSWVVQLLLR